MISGFRWSVLFVFFLLQSSLQSTAQWTTVTAGEYTYRTIPGDPMKARFYTLKNGLTVILSVNKKEPRIRTLIGIRAGSKNDPASHTGLAHYLEHLLFKGTYRYGTLDSAKESVYISKIESLYDAYNKTNDAGDRKNIYREIDSVSGIAATFAIANEYDKIMTAIGTKESNAHTSVEETVYEEDIPSNAIDRFIALQAERFRAPVFRLFHTELEAVYEEKNRGLDDDRTKVYHTMMAALFSNHNYGRQTTIGTIEHLKNPSLKAIREFYNTYYVPNNMSIVMAGDLDPEYVIKKIDQQFSYIKPGMFKEYQPEKETPITAPIIKEVKGPDAESVQIAFRLPGSYDNPSAVRAMVLSQILSNGEAGLIDLNLNKQQKVLGAGAGLNYWKDYSFFLLSGRARQDQSLEQVKDLLLQQLDIVKKGDFSETLLKAIVNNFKLFEIQGLEDNNNRAMTLMDAFIKHKGERWNEDVAFVSEMGKVTRQQIIDFARQYFSSNYVLVYKRKGEDTVEKVEKPAITPVEVNREAVSDFTKALMATPATPVKPQWLDFDKDLKKGKLDNADMLYVQNKENALFRLYYRFEIGSYHNKLLPLAAGYLQYLGTDKYTAAAISEQFYNMACSFNVSPGEEATLITITGLEENFEKAVELMEHLIRNCRPDESVLISMKQGILKSRVDSKLNKGNILNGMMQYAMYGARNPFNNQLSPAALDSVKPIDLVSILHLLPNYKHTIMYYGPKSFEAAYVGIKKAHLLPAVFKPIPPAIKYDKIQQEQNQVLFADYDMVQVEVQWVRNGPLFNPSETAVISLFNNYFGEGMGSVVFQTIRESKALAYSTYAAYTTPVKKEDRYSAVAYVGSQSDKMAEAIEGMNELLNNLPRSETALANARKSIRQTIETGRITQDEIIFSYLSAKKMGLDKDLRKEVYQAIDQLGFEDIRKFHSSNLAGKPYTYCVLASEKKVSEKELSNYGTVKKLTLEEIFGY
ncbi:MAG: insulinase family protein [Chitinophagaceae bacterium]|nr:insulinase family protein [Chitinophagaceae bacterium]